MRRKASQLLIAYCVCASGLVGQAGSNYDVAQETASDAATSMAMVVRRALQDFVTGKIKNKLDDPETPELTEPHLAGTRPDCPGGLFSGPESKAGHGGEEEVVWRPPGDIRRLLIKRGHLCEPVDPKLETTILFGIIAQEWGNVMLNCGPWTSENRRAWEKRGTGINKLILELVKAAEQLIDNPDSREKLCTRIDEMCDVMAELCE